MKKWLFSKKNKKRNKEQQALKALKLSYIDRKKKLKIKKLFSLSYYDNYSSKKKIGVKFNKFTPFNINWLLNNRKLN